MFKDEESLLKGGLHLSRALYEVNTKWADEMVRFMTVDRQEQDLYWWTVRAWSKEKSRRLAFGKCYGVAALEERRIKWQVQPNHTLVDSAFLPKGDHGVFAACAMYGWIAVRGDDAYSFTHRLKNKRMVQKCYAPLTYGDPGSGTAAQGRKYCQLMIFSKPQMNQKVQELIDNGHWEEPLNQDDPEMEKEYALQMSSRVKKTEFNAKTGRSKIIWKETKNDHARDLANAQVLGAVLIDLMPDPVAEQLSEREKKELTPV
jgi:hypothetical protein